MNESPAGDNSDESNPSFEAADAIETLSVLAGGDTSIP